MRPLVLLTLLIAVLFIEGCKPVASVLADFSAPQQASVSIQGGAAYTTTSAVSLTLTATDATEMYITNISTCSGGGTWEPFSNTKNWVLDQTEITSSVYAKFRDRAGNESSCVTDSISNRLPPTISGISPTLGPEVGGGVLVITGTQFLSGLSIVVGATSCLSSTFISSTSAECVLPPKSAGTYAVTLLNPDAQSASSSVNYTYQAAPAISNLSPTAGPVAGGGTLTINGSGFLAGLSITVGGTVCSSPSVVSATETTCTLPAKSAGSYDVVITNTDGQSGTATNAYTFQVAPTVISVNPSVGPSLGGGTLTVNGTGFLTGLSISIGGTACTSPTLVSAVQATCTLQAKTAGTYDVVLTNSDSQTGSLPNGYTYEPPPAVISVSPTAGPLAGGGILTVNGAHFLAGLTVTVGGTVCTSPALVSATQLTCTLPAKAAGAYDVVVTNTDGQTGTLTTGYTYQPAPNITSFSPTGGPPAGGGTLTVHGTGFVAGLTITVGGTTCTSPSAVSATQATCTLPAKVIGTYSVVLTNSDGQSATAPSDFTYRVPPTLNSVSPTATVLAGGSSFALEGTGFLSGFSVTVGGTACSSPSFSTSTNVSCTLPAKSAGTYDVVLTNPDGQSVTRSSAITYLPTPVITNVTSDNSNRTYYEGEIIDIKVTFNQNVSSTGLERLRLATGTTTYAINPNYGGGPMSTLIFHYTVGVGENSSDLDYFSSSALELNGGSIIGASGEAANLDLPMPGQTGSLGANKQLVVNTVTPSVGTWSAMASDVSTRTGHTAVWTGSRMIVWGGGLSVTNAGYSFNPVTNTWTTLSTTGAPTARRDHTAIWTGSKMIVWGGYGGGFLNTGGIYDPVTDSWTATTTTGAPAARDRQVAVWTGSKMIVFGGSGSGGNLNTGGVYDPDTDSWIALSTTNAPSGGEYLGAVWTGSKMIAQDKIYDLALDTWTSMAASSLGSGTNTFTYIWTGTRLLRYGSSSGGLYDPDTDTWTAISTTDAPEWRDIYSAVWTGSKMIVWGGSGWSSGYLRTGHIYDLATDSWSRVTAVNAPDARGWHKAVWTGTQMIVFGGYASPTPNSGGVYTPP